MKKRLLAILLCACMCLAVTGCGGGETEDTEETASSERAASVSNSNLSAESHVVSVGQTTVSYSEYKVYYFFMKKQYEGTLGSEIWSYDKTGTGESIGEEAIESVLRLIIQVKVICKEAAIENVTLGTDEKEEADYNAKTAYEDLSEEEKSENGIELTTLTKIFEENKLSEKMYNVEMGKVNVDLTSDQIKAARVQLIYLAANEENKADVKKKMQQIRDGLKTSETSFYVTAKEQTEADEIECLIGNSDSRTNLAKAVVALKKGQTTDVIEESDGFYLAYCIEANAKSVRKEYRNQVVQEKQTKAFQEAYKSWSEKFDVKVSKALLAED